MSNQAMNKNTGAIRTKRWLLVALLAAALVAMFSSGYEWAGTWLARRWQSQLSLLDDGNVAGQMRRIAALGEPGFSVLADELDSSRESIANGARRILFGQLEQWESLSAEEVTPRLVKLSRAVAGEVGGLDDKARLIAGDLALRIILWPPDKLTRERDQLIEPCTRILDARKEVQLASNATARAELDRRRNAGDKTLPATSAGEINEMGVTNQPEQGGTQIRLPTESLARIPGGALPIEPADDRGSSSPSRREDEQGPKSNGQEMPTPTRRTLLAAGPSAIPVRLGSQANNARPLEPSGDTPTGSGPRSDSPTSDQRTVSAQQNVLAADKPRIEKKIEGTSAGELMRLLNGADTATAAWARAELKRRGFSTAELRLAERLADPDPLVRRRWVRYLPGMRGIDAQQWLLWLSRDNDSEVRLTAITLMASSTNREILDRLAALAADDDDARIRRQAERILQAGRTNTGRGRR